MSWPQERALEQVNLAKQALYYADKVMEGVTDYSPDGPSRRKRAERHDARAMVHATLAVAYSNMEE